MRDYGGRDAATVDLLLLAACTAVALFGYALPRPWVGSIATGLKQSVLLPVVALNKRAAQDRAARFGLSELIGERDSLALIALSDSSLRRENQELRDILGLRQRVTTPWVSASVMHRPSPTDGRTVSIDVGRSMGVRQFDPVLTADGLIGYVWNAGDATSVVLTWLHPDFGASAVTSSGDVLGFLQPVSIGTFDHPFLELRGLPLSDTLAVGEQVSTSGLGGVYPQGIPVGRVVGVAEDPLGYERFYRVAAYANPGLASHVIVLTTPRDSAFSAMLSPDSLP